LAGAVDVFEISWTSINNGELNGRGTKVRAIPFNFRSGKPGIGELHGIMLKYGNSAK
jgi:hypothetical protein